MIQGTPTFVAPEVIKRVGYGLPCDMWSIGVITFVLLSGEVPFFGETIQELFVSICTGKIIFDDVWKDISPLGDLFPHF